MTTAVLAVVAIVSLGAPVGATERRPPEQERSRKAGLEREIDELEADLHDLSHEERELRAQLDSARRRRQELDDRVAAVERDIAATEADLAAATLRLEAIEAELHATEARLHRARSRLSQARDELRARAVAAYVAQPASRIADSVLESPNLRELAARRSYATAMIEAQARTIDKFRAVRDEINVLLTDQGVVRTQATVERDSVAERRGMLEAQRDAQQQLRADALAHESEERALLERVRRQRVKYEAELAALRRESDAISQLLRTVQAGQRITTTANARIGLPIPGATLTSRFGPRVHPIFGTVRMHTGIDFAAATGTPIRAAASGRVIFAGARGGYGNTIIIDHGDALATLYAHLSVVGVSEGTQVARGVVIGAVGMTGYTTGPHLHFELRVAGNPVDPIPYF